MAQGFVIEKSRSSYEVSRWVPGPPQRSFWTAIKLPDNSLPLGAFRCTQCGHVEFYAGEVFELR